MKKFFSLMAIAIASLSFVSCSDKDGEAILTVDPSFSNGLVVARTGGFYKIPITADQAWTARLGDGCNWAKLLDTNGMGSDTITICIDANYHETGRKSNVLITSGDKVIAVPISQRTPDENAGSDYYDLCTNKGLGFGFDISKSKFRNKAVSVFNLEAINLLINESTINKLRFRNMFVTDEINDFDAKDIHVDSIEKKKDSLHVALSFNINYGLFHLGVSGGYNGGEDRRTDSKRYKVNQTLPKLIATVNYKMILNEYRNWIRDGRKFTKTEGGEDYDYRAFLLSSTVTRQLDSLETSIDSTHIRHAAEGLYNDLGPALIVGSTLGGSLALDLYVDTVYFKEYMHLDSAKVTAAFKSGLFSFDAKVNVSYVKDAVEMLKHSNCTADIKGGDGAVSSKIFYAFRDSSYTQLDSLFQKWANSVVLSKESNKNTASLIDVDLVPIWVLVDEYNPARAYMRKYVLEQLKATQNQQLIDRFAEFSY